MSVYTCSGKRRGVAVSDEKYLNWKNFFGIAGVENTELFECRGMFYLETDEGRYEAEKFEVISAEVKDNKITLVQRGGSIEIKMSVEVDNDSNVFSLKTTMSNLDVKEHTIYACLPRIALQGAGFEVYTQYAAWCAENQGLWQPLHAGNIVLTNIQGCSAENSTPFICFRRPGTDQAFAMHLLPIGDWIIRARHAAGHRTSFTILEAGLSNESLRLPIAPGAQLPMPEILMYSFSGDIRDAGEPIQRYLLKQFPDKPLQVPAYNTWFYDFDVLNEDELREQARAAKETGCSTFVVDAGWNGEGIDWTNQTGNWTECTERAFYGRMGEFLDYVRSIGLDAGLWIEPERACVGTPVYEEHKDWFLKSDAIIFDYSKDEVIDYLAGEVTRMVKEYDLKWIMLDFNTNMGRDLTGTNFYYYMLYEPKLYEEIRRRNPGCWIEGNSGGGRRSDIVNSLKYYDGFFISDTVDPLEILRVRQGYALRNLPAFSAAWYVMQEVDFPCSSYEDHQREGKKKVFCCGDPWWERVVDYSPEFGLAVGCMGELGFTGNIGSLTGENKELVKKTVEEFSNDREFLRKTICHLLTEPKPMDDITGWAVMQYENEEMKRSRIFAFRLVDDTEQYFVYPKNIDDSKKYKIVANETAAQLTGKEINCFGIMIDCPKRYSARIIDIYEI